MISCSGGRCAQTLTDGRRDPEILLLSDVSNLFLFKVSYVSELEGNQISPLYWCNCVPYRKRETPYFVTFPRGRRFSRRSRFFLMNIPEQEDRLLVVLVV